MLLLGFLLRMTIATTSNGVSFDLPKLRWNLTAEEIVPMTKGLLAKCNSELDRIGTLDKGTFEGVVLPLAELERLVMTELAPCSFLQHVSMDSKVREASVEATKLMDRYQIDKSMREDLLQATQFVAENSAEMAKLDDESKRLIEKMMTGFRRSGMLLGPKERAELKKKRERLAELEVSFANVIAEDRSTVAFTEAELEGCPEDFIKGLSKNEEGRFLATMQYPDVFGILKYAKREETRRRMDEAFNNRAKGNVKLLAEAVALRQQCAQLLGYENHAAFQLEERLAKQPGSVLEFEADLRSKLLPLAQKELQALNEIQQQETTKSTAFRTWNYQYYTRLILERDFAVDAEKIKEYFSLEQVLIEMLRVYETVLGLRFRQLNEPKATWHADVRLYEVTNSADDTLVGHLYLDLFPREGKYTHAANFNLQPGAQLNGGTRQYPATAIVANFSKPGTDKPSLLKHDEVVTMFHELGHAMHDLCGLTRYSRFHGTAVETDFVEAPSQMLENWCWDEETLARLGRHYQRSEESIPRDIVQRMIRAKNLNAGLTNLRQVFFGLFDLKLHSLHASDKPFTAEEIDRIYGDLRKEITLLEQPEGISPSSSFGHLMGGYDAGYYGYLWSQVFSADMFYSRFKKEGLLNAKCGQAYRQEILMPGGSRDGMKSLVSFLGRKPTSDAFMRSLGLTDEHEEL